MGFRDSRSGTVNGQQEVSFDCPMFVKDPNLHECLAGYVGDKGKMIPGCTIMLFFEGGQVKMCVKDKHYKRLAFAILNPCLKLSAALEEVLEGPGLEWRPDRHSGA